MCVMCVCVCDCVYVWSSDLNSLVVHTALVWTLCVSGVHQHTVEIRGSITYTD